MRLTRRDAIAALGAAGVSVGGSAAFLSEDEPGQAGGTSSEAGPGDSVLRTLTAAAEVLYPSQVEGIEAFLAQYVRGKTADRPDFRRGVEESVRYLDEYAKAWYDTPFADLDPTARETALHRMSADTADPDPEGSDVQRVRYYVVNELLYALYSAPTGGELVGLENPRGHPGGLESYQRGPRS